MDLFGRAVAANPGEVTALFDGITEMQEMTSRICYDAKVGDTKQLNDSRDGKTYWITKLKDSNCWMTQNLDYDGGGTKINAPSAWTDTSNSFQAYYDPGNYYHTPSLWTACNGNGTGLSACTSNGWTTSGDAHYHAGNYYSWQAAISDVCPSGWKLPYAGTDPSGSSTTAVGQFANLLNNLGVADIVKAPYYFVPGGFVYSGSLSSAGSQGRYWSSTAYDGTNAYFLYFDSGNVNPSNTNYRYFGLSVRCLVQGS